MNEDYDKLLDEELLRLETRKIIARATQVNDFVETLLENPSYRVIDGKIIFNSDNNPEEL